MLYSWFENIDLAYPKLLWLLLLIPLLIWWYKSGFNKRQASFTISSMKQIPSRKTWKNIFIHFEQFPNRIEIVITDDGAGFDAQPYMEIEPSRATHGNGRGIAKANLLSFDEVLYLGPGNQVKVISYTKYSENSQP